jgi:hypothetical protein
LVDRETRGDRTSWTRGGREGTEAAVAVGVEVVVAACSDADPGAFSSCAAAASA